MTDRAPSIVHSHDISLDKDYVQWIADVKNRFRRAQIKAAVKVNSEQLLFNWQLGRDLVVRKAEEKWGKGVVEQISLDLQNEFPDVKGFSARNLWYMKSWYVFYADDKNFSDQADAIYRDLNKRPEKLHQLGAEMGKPDGEKLHQPGAEIDFPRLFGYVPWRHHVEIITKCKSVPEALFYIRKTIEEGWSRNTLINCIKADLYHKEGTAVTNFSERLPGLQGKLAQEIVKDTYDLSFITLPKNFDEKMLEDALERKITRFLLELGKGFAFIGRQKEIIVSGKTRKIDLLFYHIRLRCYVVVELKVVSFEPEFAGKLNFYVNAVDELMKADDDNPTIGLLICRDKDNTEVKWAFRGINTPMGVATFDHINIEGMEDYLPTNEQIQKQIALAEEELLQDSSK